MALDYKATMARATAAMLATNFYGTAFTYKGTSYACQAPPINREWEMRPNNYQEQIPVQFQMLATAFASSGITLKSVITYGGFNFQVASYDSDDRDPTVTLNCVRKQ